MSNQSKIRRDKETGYPEYKKIEDVGESHVHTYRGYTKSGKYYEGGHGENVTAEEKSNRGIILKKERGD